MHLLGPTIDLHFQADHQVPTNDQFTRVVQDVDFYPLYAASKMSVGQEEPLDTCDEQAIEIVQCVWVAAEYRVGMTM